MRLNILFITVIAFVAASCTKEKTDYEAGIEEAVPDYGGFEEAMTIRSGKYDLSIETLNGAFYKGYNEIRLKITDSDTREKANVISATFLPIMKSGEDDWTSCPHLYALIDSGAYFSGYAVFSEESIAQKQWALHISFIAEGRTHKVEQTVSVQEQTNRNRNMTVFTGNDGEQYYIALVSPLKPKVGENALVAGIYMFNRPTSAPSGEFPDPTQFLYKEVSGYTLRLDPRMPEPSMGNHSSPNNRDLTQRDDGLYEGVVNYTMTGNWTLNFILHNEDGRIVKGTEVPTDFTPGIEGRKSELHIDVLF